MQVEGLHVPSAPPRVRRFLPSDLHVTLAFLGAVHEAEARTAWALVGGFRSFRCVTGSFDRVQPLGHPRKPSALCAIVADGRDVLSAMIAEARAPLLAAAGAAEDDRSPLPHMTIARVQRRAKSAERRQALQWAETIDVSQVTFTVASIALYTWSVAREERLFRIVERHDMSP